MININDDGTLKCPHCTSEHLLLRAPTEYFQQRAGGVRRFVGVGFACASCGTKPELMLKQKGNTIRIEWRAPAEDTVAETKREAA